MRIVVLSCARDGRAAQNPMSRATLAKAHIRICEGFRAAMIDRKMGEIKMNSDAVLLSQTRLFCKPGRKFTVLLRHALQILQKSDGHGFRCPGLWKLKRLTLYR